MKLKRLGRTGLLVSEVALGTSPLGGGMAEAYGHGADSGDGQVTAREIVSSPINFVDTSNEYSGGESERLIGEAIGALGGLPDGFVLATKVDPLGGWQAREWPASRVRESFRESAERLGVSSFPLLYLHDPERIPFEVMTAAGGPVEELVRLRGEGFAEHLGVALGDLEQAMRYVDLGVFEVVLNHNNYTLLDQGAEPLIEYCDAAEIAFVNAAPYASGVLAKGVGAKARYRYGQVEESTRRRILAIEATCSAFGVPLRVAALQFSLRDRRIASTVVGVSAPGRASQLVADAEAVVPDELWRELGVAGA